jgi:sterol desaturase/sphingolipid hydroxylase (fatty acid hydroxylase superfamily)
VICRALLAKITFGEIIRPGMRVPLAEYIAIVRLVAFLALAFWVIERIGRHAQQSGSNGLANYLYLPFALGWICSVQALAGPPISRLVALAGGGVLSQFIPARGSVLAEILFSVMFAIVFDVWQYWVHRWQHLSPILWQIHKFHHSDTNVSSSTQARNHPLNHLYLIACYAPVLILFGVIAPHALAALLMFRVWGFVNHANVRISFGLLTGIIAGPQWHRIHHSVEPRHLDKNFAAYFPFVDRMFGTFYMPEPDEYPQTGLVNKEPESFLCEATTAPFIAWYLALRQRFTSNANNSRSALWE